MAAHELYKRAYDAHYTNIDYHKAVEGYKRVIELYPESAEAEFARNKLPIAELKMKRKDNNRKRESTPIEVDKVIPVEFQLTTSNTLHGYKVVKTIGMVSSECASEIAISPESTSKYEHDAGGRVRIEHIIRRTRMDCMKKLKISAETLGANAVLNIKLSHSSYRMENEHILCTVAYGTAVLIII